MEGRKGRFEASVTFNDRSPVAGRSGACLARSPPLVVFLASGSAWSAMSRQRWWRQGRPVTAPAGPLRTVAQPPLSDGRRRVESSSRRVIYETETERGAERGAERGEVGDQGGRGGGREREMKTSNELFGWERCDVDGQMVRLLAGGRGGTSKGVGRREGRGEGGRRSKKEVDMRRGGSEAPGREGIDTRENREERAS